MQILENILYKIKNNSIRLLREEYITQLALVCQLMTQLFKSMG